MYFGYEVSGLPAGPRTPYHALSTFDQKNHFYQAPWKKYIEPISYRVPLLGKDDDFDQFGIRRTRY